MTYRLLNTLSLSQILPVFNEAFSDYIMPMPPMAPAVFQWKLDRDGVALELSPGFFDEQGSLQGFMLHAPGIWQGKKTIYNAGTGIIPAGRRKKGASGLFDYCLPLLREAGTELFLLECITQNHAALALYEKVGFSRERELICFQGNVPDFLLPSPLRLEKETLTGSYPWDTWQNWGHFPSSWQNARPAIERVQSDFQFIQLHLNGLPVAYAIFKPDNGYLAQFAVAPTYRRQGIGTHLLQTLQRSSSRPITLVNVDQRDQATLAFLQKIAFKETVRQYEMMW